MPPTKRLQPLQSYSKTGNSGKAYFIDTWLDIVKFKPWLDKKMVPSYGWFKAFCVVCYEVISNHKSTIQNHMKSTKHREKLPQYDDIITVRQALLSYIGPAKKEEISTYEMVVCSLVAEKSLSISLVDHLIPTMRRLHPKDEILKQVKLGRTKATSIIKDGFGNGLKKMLVEKLRTTFFPILIDKLLAVMVYYWDSAEFKLMVYVLDFVVCKEATSDGLSVSVLGLLDNLQIPLDNFIGFSADTCNVMFRLNHSVSTILKERIPSIVLVKCSCHFCHLVANYASKALPDQLKKTLRMIFAYFSRSSNRKREFAKFQEFAGVQQSVILSPGQTRWLSLRCCVIWILENLEPLILYFTAEVLDDKNKVSLDILTYIRHPMTKPLLLFMEYALGLLDDFNTVFQGEAPLLHELQPR
ncbi:Uncharacterized protein APZ42_026576, partial [Daphnia magna]